jgi:hypothetical protein
MKLRISKEGTRFVVDDMSPGTPTVGRGRTMLEAIGSWFHNHQNDIGLEFEVDETAMPAEMRRRSRELSKR